jgi:hypothetical protein
MWNPQRAPPALRHPQGADRLAGRGVNGRHIVPPPRAPHCSDGPGQGVSFCAHVIREGRREGLRCSRVAQGSVSAFHPTGV